MNPLSSLNSQDLLLSQLQSNAAVQKPMEKQEAEENAGVGNVLDSFGNLLKEQMSHINTLQGQADQAVQTYATGGEIELHNVILATEKADMALQLTMQIRNRLVAAYQEISRMNV